MFAFSLGGENKEVVSVDVLSRVPRDEEGWIVCEIHVNAGGFSGTYRASLTVQELEGFNAALKALYHSLKGEAWLRTTENQLELRLIGNGRGGIELEGEAQDDFGFQRNILKFRLELDQTHLASAIRQFEELKAWIKIAA